MQEACGRCGDGVRAGRGAAHDLTDATMFAKRGGFRTHRRALLTACTASQALMRRQPANAWSPCEAHQSLTLTLRADAINGTNRPSEIDSHHSLLTQQHDLRGHAREYRK